jgi:hypothetical protein
MCSATTATIDDLALTVEHTIAENETALTEYEDEFTSFEDHEVGQPPGTEDIDVAELFSGSA